MKCYPFLSSKVSFSKFYLILTVLFRSFEVNLFNNISFGEFYEKDSFCS
jgi:hypothetical protein